MPKTGITNHNSVAPVRALRVTPLQDANAARINRIIGIQGYASAFSQQLPLIFAIPARNTVSQPNSTMHSHLGNFSIRQVNTQKHNAPHPSATKRTVAHVFRPITLRIAGIIAVSTHARSCGAGILFSNPGKSPFLFAKHRQGALFNLILP